MRGAWHTLRKGVVRGPGFCWAKRNASSEIPKQGGSTPNVAQSTSERMVESWEDMMKPQTKPSLVDRWDWHAWQLFAALIPSFIILGLASYADRDMEARNKLVAAAKEKAAAEERRKLQQEAPQAGPEEAPKVEDRIAALERQVKQLLDSATPQGKAAPVPAEKASQS